LGKKGFSSPVGKRSTTFNPALICQGVSDRYANNALDATKNKLRI